MQVTPSGHLLQSHLVAYALVDVTGDNGQLSADFIDTAARIAENREFGVHYKSDSESGELIARLVFPVLRTIFWDVFDVPPSRIGPPAAIPTAPCRGGRP